MPSTKRPLSGIRVIDFTRVLAGPYCTALLADMGAEVIKIESIEGDDYRHIGPFFNGKSALFEGVNRGKKSIAMDLKNLDEIKALRALISRSDVVVENFRPGVMAKLGLGPEVLRADSDRLVFASISGFGQTGPNAMRPAYDIIVQAMTGLMELTGSETGDPTMIGESFGDVAAGLFSSWAIMVALFERERTGRGRTIDVSLFDSLLAMMPTAAARVLLANGDPARTGNKHPLSAPFGVYPAGDGFFAVAVLNDRLFKAFCEVIGCQDFVADPRFATDAGRRENEPALAEAIIAWARDLTAADAVKMLANVGVPSSEIMSARQAWMSSQTHHRKLYSNATTRDGNQLPLPEQPAHFIGDQRGGRRAAPELNEHNDEIRELIEAARP
jgi:CoA:oxalate CoA-transferase